MGLLTDAQACGAIIKNFCSRSSVWEMGIIEMLERAVFRGVVEVWSKDWSDGCGKSVSGTGWKVRFEVLLTDDRGPSRTHASMMLPISYIGVQN
jgi:hypothetical protein